jgi:hypothetical protein
MKRAFLATFLLPFALGAQTPAGPISKGSMLVDGSAGFSHNSSSGSQSSTTISVSPEVLYFVATRLAVGGQLGLSYSKASNSSIRSWSLGPAARYYFAQPEARTLPFVGVAAAYGSSSFSPASGTDSDQISTMLEGVGGITRMLARHVGISGELFAAWRNNEVKSGAGPSSDFTQTTFGLRFSISAFVF